VLAGSVVLLPAAYEFVELIEVIKIEMITTLINLFDPIFIITLLYSGFRRFISSPVD
jgi:hypothetical protein